MTDGAGTPGICPGDDDVEVRRVQPYEARKRYTCPGCNQEIGVGVGHLVAVPRHAPDLRRHWHHPCWDRRDRRRPGRDRPRSARGAASGGASPPAGPDLG